VTFASRREVPLPGAGTLPLPGDPTPPLGMPAGSVRAILALMLSLVVWYLVYQGRALPVYLADTAFLGIAFYFGARTSDEEKASEKPRRQPLFLPRGFVRGLIVGGFLGLYGLLWWQGRPADPVVTAIFELLAGYAVGVGVSVTVRATSKRARPTALAAFGHARAMLTLVGVGFLCVAAVTGQDAVVPPVLLTALQFLVAFYFGSRSVR